MEQNYIGRPDKVRHALTLLYISLAIGVLLAIALGPNIANETARELSTDLNFSYEGAWILAFLFTVLMMGVSVGLAWFFIFMIGRRKDWARITYLVLFIISAPFSLMSVAKFGANPVFGLISLGESAMQIIALVFLFQKPSSDWFHHRDAAPFINQTADTEHRLRQLQSLLDHGVLTLEEYNEKKQAIMDEL